jgi:hypothetical protein
VDGDPAPAQVDRHDLELRHPAGLVVEDLRELGLGRLARGVELDHLVEVVVEEAVEAHRAIVTPLGCTVPEM